jgi:hypothetical protein
MKALKASEPRSEPILSLQDGHTLLTLYESMLAAARMRDWDRLSDIERKTTAICDAAAAHQTPARTAEELVELSALLTRIQSLDHAIRNHLEPAHEEARQLLAIEVKGRTLRSAYGVDDSNDFHGPGG